MTKEFHIYKQRHVFLADDAIGKWDVTARTVRLATEFAAHAADLQTWFMRQHGVPLKVLVGDEEVKQAAPLREFPAEIRALMDPALGHLTPAAIDHARANFPPEEFDKRYRGAVEFEVPKPPQAREVAEPEAETPTSPVEPAPKQKRGK